MRVRGNDSGNEERAQELEINYVMIEGKKGHHDWNCKFGSMKRDRGSRRPLESNSWGRKEGERNIQT